MNIYQVDDGDNDTFVGTLDEARDIVRQAAAPFRAAIQVHLLDIPVTKENVLAMLNENWKSETIRSWHGTARGGLQLLGE